MEWCNTNDLIHFKIPNRSSKQKKNAETKKGSQPLQDLHIIPVQSSVCNIMRIFGLRFSYYRVDTFLMLPILGERKKKTFKIPYIFQRI